MHQNDALLSLIRSEVERVQTTFPGVVVSYNRARQTAVRQRAAGSPRRFG